MVTLFLILYILTEVYRIEKYCIMTKYRDTYRIVSTVYRYTSTSWLDDELVQRIIFGLFIKQSYLPFW